MMEVYKMIILLAILVDGVLSADTDEVISVMEGETVTLNTSVSKKQHDIMRWYFNDTLISQINSKKNCLYDGEDGRFRDRLVVDNATGSLTITNIRSKHAGRYEAEIIRSESSGTSQSLNRNSKCDSTKIINKTSNMGDSIKIYSVTVRVAGLRQADSQKDITEPETDKRSGLSAGAVAGIVIGLLVCVAAVTAGVIHYRLRRTRNERERRRPEVLYKIQTEKDT